MEPKNEITPNSRRNFLSKVGALSILPFSTLQAFEENDQETTDNFFEAGPYLQNLSSNTVTIMWVTRKNSFSWIEYGDRSFLNKKFFNYHNGLIQANNRVNKITLEGIKPGQAHKYRIVSTEILQVNGSQYQFGKTLSSEIYNFNTPQEKEESFNMVILNDHHERPQTIPQLLYKFGYTGNKKDFDLVVFNGDVFNNTESEEQIIQQFLKPCVDIFAKEIPFLFVQGNHEVRGAFSRHIPEYFSFVEERFYHAFTRGPLRVIVLDAGEDKTDDNWEYGGLAAFDRYRERQREWLAREISSGEHQSALFRIVLIHISPWHSGDWHGTLHCRELFGPLLNQGKVDLLISGHTHRYATHPADQDHNFPIMIGGGPQEGGRTLIKIRASTQQVQADMIRDDGENVGSFTITRKA